MTSGGILIVQDDFLSAERLRALLTGRGYAIAGIASRTRGAERLARRERPDLAIIDMMLEVDADGIQTATALAREHGLKILITTGFPDSIIQDESVPAIACAIVKKPYTDEEILQAVAKCLE